MRHLISNDLQSCVGCNRCIRNCPVEEANIAYLDPDGKIKVRVDNSKCIACGACIQACQHGSRDYEDDTERFLADLRSGLPISLFSAPAGRSNMYEHGRVLSWLRQLGVRKIYDVSFGADICTWAYIRYIQRYKPASAISQPCPAIVNYVLMHRQELLRYLIPVQSPMLCTAIYMRAYMGIDDHIAALSPCIAKANEFEQTNGLVSYNITFKKLEEYIFRHGIQLPEQESGYDHADSALGSVFPMPGGLKENVEFYLGKALRVDKSEGQSVVYRALDSFVEEPSEHLPAVFDVLNCAEGCNLGTGCRHERSIFEINTRMDEARRRAVEGRKRSQFDKLFAHFDKQLRLQDFMRRYAAQPTRTIPISDQDIEWAFLALDKRDEEQRRFDCTACGSDSCYGMARKIAKGVNCAANCIEKARNDISREHDNLVRLQHKNLSDISRILEDITSVKGLSDDIVSSIDNVNSAVEHYGIMAGEIGQIARRINIISLNASVEAARAGTAGLPFSVIAEEIRSLSNNSSKSVAGTEAASREAREAIAHINEIIAMIGVAIDQSYGNITNISQATNRALTKSDSD